jgi:N-acetylmuramoyl-L-alanine amidase
MVLVVAGAAAAIMWMRVQEPKERAAEQEAVKQAEQWRISVNEAELDLLARVVHAEAKGEPYEGQVAVAAVIINRVQHPEFPNTIAGVVYEPLAFQVVANGQVNKPADEAAIRAAHDALNGFDPTGGAVYFYNPAKTASAWIRSRPVIKTIGRHVFAS